MAWILLELAARHPCGRACEQRELAGAMMAGMDSLSPRGSVIIPAHNESAVIVRTVSSLMKDAEPGEFQVVVVCNGCSDGTAEQVRSLPYRDVGVLELGSASKSRAMNAGDCLSTAFPRLYLDADVTLSTDGARRMLGALSGADCVVATPDYQLAGCTRMAVAYWREWIRRNPSPMAGTGCFGLSQAARESIGEFPDLLGDDRFIASTFAPVRVAGARTEVRVARTLPSILRRRVRIERGNQAVRRFLGQVAGPAGPGNHPPSRGRQGPNAVGLGTLIVIHKVAIAWARVRPAGSWMTDLSSRRPTATAL